jgi:hypothetical protein
MVCSNCGTEIRDGIKVCPVCEGTIFIPKVEKPVYKAPEVQRSHKKKGK